MAATGQTQSPTTRQESRPDPDPTLRTTEQLLREISLVREIFASELKGLKTVIETRLDGMDKAIELLQVRSDKIPMHIAGEVGQLQKLHDEKFHSIETQFLERDTRTEQTSRDSKVAVDAALQAAKEAVGEQNKSNALAIAKSEAAFTKQIDQIGILVSTMAKTSDDKIDDLKSRVQSMEGRDKGFGIIWAAAIAVGGLVIGALGFASRFIK